MSAPDICGQQISHYRVIDVIGRGGMGIVYHAEDLRLGRSVALKFMSPDLAVSPDAVNRLEREARAASAIDHPNICTVYEIGDAGDRGLFIAMGFYQGETLAARISRGPIPVADAVDLAQQVASGLEAAHRRGVVHRDLKPANLFITTEGRVKILDFGLARLDEVSPLTRPGTLMGTLTYMSPEQLRGEEVDARADLWALGVTLYEMLNAAPPFSGSTPAGVMNAILREPPQPPRASTPAALQRVIGRALQKERSRRYDSAASMAADLGPIAAAGAPAPRPAVSRKTPRMAVLPFLNTKPDAEADFLTNAVADQLIAQLQYVQGLLVRPASVVRKYRPEQTDPLAAGAELDVDYTLAGTYLRSGAELRLHFELLDVASGDSIWSDSLTAPFGDTFALLDLAGDKVRQELTVRFSAGEQQRISRLAPHDPVAYEYYLRAVSYPATNEGAALARAMLEKAIELDARFAPAWYELGARLHHLVLYQWEGQERLNQAEQAFRKALELNPDLFPALSSLTSICAENGRHEEAFELAARAVRINPADPYAHLARAYVARYVGDLQSSRAAYERCISLDPKNPRWRSAGITYVSLGMYEQALSAFRLDSSSPFSQAWSGATFLRMGREEEALVHLRAVIALDPRGHHGIWASGMEAALTKEIERGLRATHEKESADMLDGESLYNTAANYALLGDRAGAFRLLTAAIDRGYLNYGLISADPLLASIRFEDAYLDVIRDVDSRRQELLRRFESISAESIPAELPTQRMAGGSDPP